MRAYDSLLGHVRELADNAARLGGAAGEVLLEECAAKVPGCLLLPCLTSSALCPLMSPLCQVHTIRPSQTCPLGSQQRLAEGVCL